MKKLIIVIVFFLSAAGAQECASLLENLTPTATFDTAEMNSTSLIYTDGQTSALDTHQVVDFKNRRLYQEATLPEMGKMVLRYADGQASMQMPGTDLSLPAPPQVSQQLEATLDSAFGMQGALPQDYEIVSCDGVQSYAGLVEGEQVTLEMELPAALGEGKTELKMLFGENGQPVGSYTDIPQFGSTLTVYETYELDDAGVLQKMVFKVYQLTGDEASLMSDTTIEMVSYNEPVDESLFE